MTTLRPVWFEEPSVGGPFVFAAPPVAAPLRQALSYTLKTDTYLYSLVSGRVYPLDVPQTVPLPAITYQILAIRRGHHLTATDGVNRALVRLTIHSKSLIDGETTAEAVRQRFDGFHGTMSTASGATITVLETLADAEGDGFFDGQDGTGRPFHYTQLDYVIRYREPRPTYGS